MIYKFESAHNHIRYQDQYLYQDQDLDRDQKWLPISMHKTYLDALCNFIVDNNKDFSVSSKRHGFKKA